MNSMVDYVEMLIAELRYGVKVLLLYLNASVSFSNCWRAERIFYT